MWRQASAIKLTISQRLWLGLGVILVLFGAADLVSLRASHTLDTTLANLVVSGARRSDAVAAMKVHAADISRSVQQYLQDRETRSRSRQRLEQSQASFEEALSIYRTLASTPPSRAFAEQAAAQYAQVKTRVDGILKLEDSKAARKAGEARQRRLGKAILDEMPGAGVPMREEPFSGQRAALKELTERIAGRVREPDVNLHGRSASSRLIETQRAFSAAIARYQSSKLEPGERDWAARADRWFAENTGMVLAILDAEAQQRQSWVDLGTARDALEKALDDGIQPSARAELAAAIDSASQTSHDANMLITRGLLIALGLAVLVALATSRAVRAPLRALVSSSRRLAEGDFSYRAPVGGGDELAELTTAFNDMAGKLQATTVSRSYMESIVNSMGEALLVSREGVIETANPAAERLLAYEPTTIVGTPTEAIAPGGFDAVAVPELPTRFVAQLRTRDGDSVPAAISAVAVPSSSSTGASIVCIAQDLRERLAADRHQRQAAVVFENTQEGIVLADAERNIVLVNPAFTKITGYSPEEVCGKPTGVVWSERHDESFCDTVWAYVEARGEWQGEVWLGCKDGEVRPVWKTINGVRDDTGCIVNYVSVFSDITAIKHAEERLNHLAHHDVLTELPNRLLLEHHLGAALSRARRLSRSVALLYLDLDDFKHVNDTLGHHEGDRLLQAMASRLRGCLEPRHCIARLGGDEFVVVVEHVADPQEAAEVAQRALTALSAPLEISGLELRMRASIGISLGPMHGTTVDELLKAADAAMYRAKRAGRGTYEFFSAELTRQALERLTLETALRDPELPGQLLLEYQPQFSVETGRLVGVEALVRWAHPTRGLIPPLQFIPVAEEIGLIRSIGDWVLRTACEQAAAWRKSGLLPIRVAVNVSAHQIRSPAIVDSVRAALERTGLPPGLLELEVTEGALQTGQEAVEILCGLKRLGVNLALDDFGTGYSALNSLKLLPLDRLKIDRSFIRDLQDDPNDQALARAIIAMGRSLGLDIIAEGVEADAQLTFLREEGCDEMQGYLTGAPMAAAAIEEKLRSGVYQGCLPAVVHRFPDRRSRRARALLASGRPANR